MLPFGFGRLVFLGVGTFIIVRLLLRTRRLGLRRRLRFGFGLGRWRWNRGGILGELGYGIGRLVLRIEKKRDEQHREHGRDQKHQTERFAAPPHFAFHGGERLQAGQDIHLVDPGKGAIHPAGHPGEQRGRGDQIEVAGVAEAFAQGQGHRAPADHRQAFGGELAPADAEPAGALKHDQSEQGGKRSRDRTDGQRAAPPRAEFVADEVGGEKSEHRHPGQMVRHKGTEKSAAASTHRVRRPTRAGGGAQGEGGEPSRQQRAEQGGAGNPHHQSERGRRIAETEVGEQDAKAQGRTHHQGTGLRRAEIIFFVNETHRGSSIPWIVARPRNSSRLPEVFSFGATQVLFVQNFYIPYRLPGLQS